MVMIVLMAVVVVVVAIKTLVLGVFRSPTLQLWAYFGVQRFSFGIPKPEGLDSNLNTLSIRFINNHLHGSCWTPFISYKKSEM